VTIDRTDSEQPLWVFRLTSGLAARLAPLSLALFVGSIAGYAFVARNALGVAQIPILLTILTAVLVLVGHEALHGVGFLAFGGRPKFGAGIRGAVPYFFATCPAKRFSWGSTLVIGALPLVAIDLVALAFAGYGPLVVPAMLAFAVNTAGAVGDLWLIGVILQTPRTALFEDTEEPAMIAWPGPGIHASASRPRGLEPKGFESIVIWSGVGAGLLAVSFTALGFVLVGLARGSSSGKVTVAGLELVRMTSTGHHFSAQVSFLPVMLMAAIISIGITLAARTFAERIRRGRRLRL